MRRIAITTAVACIVPVLAAAADQDSIRLLDEFRPIGGGGNNLVHPNYDPVPGSPEIAIAEPNFVPDSNREMIDGPNARTISNVIAGGTGADGTNGDTNDPIASAWLYVFGQFVDHDLDLQSTPLTMPSMDITVPPLDPVFTHGTTIAMNRAIADPTTNTIINAVAGYLDLSQLYGSTQQVADSLRNPDGTFKSSSNGQALPIVGGVFVSGDGRVMENPELTAVTALFMREHNFWVRRLGAEQPAWTGDQLYQMARAITTAEYQNIVYREYLPLLIGRVLGPYRGYDSNVSAQVTQEFSTAAFRVGHSQISGTQEGIDNNGKVVFVESLAQSFFNTPAEDVANGIDPLLRSLGVDHAQATDVYAVSALRNLLFAPLAGGGVDQVDLIAIDIQRERDVGLGTLNQTRKALHLPPYSFFSQLTEDPVLQKSLADVYGSIDNVDLFIGGLAEAHAPGALVGPTFQAIIAQQFEALRSGDRFFWRNQHFGRRMEEMIAEVRLSDIMRRNTDSTNLQTNLFLTTPPARYVEIHLPRPTGIDSHGRRGRPFIADAW